MEDSWKTLVRLCHSRDLLFDGETRRYTKPQRAEISSLLSRSIPRFKSMTDIVSVLSDKSLYPFLEFLVPLCEDLRDRMELKNFDPRVFEDSSIEKVISVSDQRKESQLLEASK
jgi:hypothetical protein